MKLYPAIDILGGNAVRLVRGDFAAKQVYDEDPLTAARRWTEAGARRLHVVDLDGAREGRLVNLEYLRRIADELDVPVQYGGGLRSSHAVADALHAGAERVVLGTAAFTDPVMLESVLARHGPARVAVSVDVRDGRVLTEGWTHSTDTQARDAFANLYALGVKELVFTNVDRDGMLGGANRDEVIWVAKAAENVNANLLYSGGIGTVLDLKALKALQTELDLKSLDGVIVGKALYEGRFTIGEAHTALCEPSAAPKG